MTLTQYPNKGCLVIHCYRVKSKLWKELGLEFMRESAMLSRIDSAGNVGID